MECARSFLPTFVFFPFLAVTSFVAVQFAETVIIQLPSCLLFLLLDLICLHYVFPYPDRQVPSILQIIPFPFPSFTWPLATCSYFSTASQLCQLSRAQLSENLGIRFIPCFCKSSVMLLAILSTVPICREWVVRSLKESLLKVFGKK